MRPRWPTPAKGRPRRRAGEMNKLEARYDREIIQPRIIAGEYQESWFEEWKFRIADKTWYTPDFVVMLPDGTLEIHECKGFMQDDANVKLKAVAEKFPLPVRLVKWSKADGWDIRAV